MAFASRSRRLFKRRHNEILFKEVHQMTATPTQVPVRQHGFRGRHKHKRRHEILVTDMFSRQVALECGSAHGHSRNAKGAATRRFGDGAGLWRGGRSAS